MRVELHTHLDGSIRYETIYRLMKSKNMAIPGDGSLEALKEACIVTQPSDLAHYLSCFAIFAPAFCGDVVAIEEMAYEFVVDKAACHVAYVEARYSPHLLSTASVGVREVITAVNKGFNKGMQECHGIKVRTILCCIRGQPQWSVEVAELCCEFRSAGVVGIDCAGDEAQFVGPNGECRFDKEDIEAFTLAAENNIHRTCHAGESGPPEMVKLAVESLQAERIGHGYHVLQDEGIYASCREKRIHFEVCPISSFLTGSVKFDVDKHPLINFWEDKTLWSINDDDTTPQGSTLESDYSLLYKWGMRECDFATANLNAARASFLPEDEKEELLAQLYSAYNFKE